VPQLLVVTDLPEAGGQVVYRERIVSSDFESRHFTGQLAERLGWAVRDAHALADRHVPVDDPAEVGGGGEGAEGVAPVAGEPRGAEGVGDRRVAVADQQRGL
jgi:hypothetical protein